MPTRIWTGLVVLLSACGSGGSEECGTDCPETVLVLPATTSNELDILYVIDNSPGMLLSSVDGVIANTPALLDTLGHVATGVPDLHIGVVTSDMGAGDFLDSACSVDGDGGQLQSTPGDGAPFGCPVPDGPFISGVTDPDALTETLTCIGRLGSGGCGFEQHLEAMRTALSDDSTGFVRPSAGLAVVIIADEDDCSALDTGIFDTDSTRLSELGPYTGYRCAEFGIQCATGNDDPRAPGPRDGCEPQADSPWIYHSDFYADFLRDMKPSGAVAVIDIIGDPTPVSVVLNVGDGNPELGASCDFNGQAAPGVRLAHLASSFASSGATFSICDDDFAAEVTAAGRIMRTTLGHPCIDRVIDRDSAPGLQHDCTVTQQSPDRDDQSIPPCEDASPTCFRLEDSPTLCDDTASPTALVIDRAEAPPTGTSYRLDCRRPSPGI